MALIFTLSNKDTFLRSCNAGLKLLLLLLLSILLSSANLFAFSFVFALVCITELTHRLGLVKKLFQNKFLLFVTVFIFISDFVNTKDILLSLFSSLKFLTLLSLSLIFTSVTSPDESARSLGHALSPLLGKAGYHIASAIELTLALLPMIFSTSTELLDARKSRGGNFIKHPIKTISDFVIALISTLLTKIDAFADALNSRGYDLFVKRSSPPFNKKDLLLSFILLLTIGVMVYDKI